MGANINRPEDNGKAGGAKGAKPLTPEGLSSPDLTPATQESPDQEVLGENGIGTQPLGLYESMSNEDMDFIMQEALGPTHVADLQKKVTQALEEDWDLSAGVEGSNEGG